jgi:probable phosphomutase (TIGR03848 family)
MCILLLIRHGDNDYIQAGRLPGRLPGIHLNENGRAIINSLAERLSSIPVRAIYSSPLERTMETAELIAQPHKIGVVPRDGLIEIDCGDWQGLRLSKLRRNRFWRIVQNSPSRFCFPSGESFYEAQQRICKEVEFLSKKHGSEELVICVSHADPIRLAVAYYVGMPLDLFQRLHVAPASITALCINQSETRLLFLNYEVSISLAKA